MQTVKCLFFISLLHFSQVLAAALSTSVGSTSQTSLWTPDTTPSSSNRTKVPGESPAFHCSNPTNDLFQIRRLDFIPTNPRIGYYLDIRFIGRFVSPTGDVPWLNITGSINGRPERGPLYYSPLCDIDVFQDITVQSPAGDYDQKPRSHRSCPPSIQPGYAIISSPPMPLTPPTVPEGKYQVRAEATAQDGRRIFCVQGEFDVTT